MLRIVLLPSAPPRVSESRSSPYSKFRSASSRDRGRSKDGDRVTFERRSNLGTQGTPFQQVSLTANARFDALPNIHQREHSKLSGWIKIDDEINIAVVVRGSACDAARDGELKHAAFAKNRFGSSERAHDPVQ